MKQKINRVPADDKRRGERGAALITMLLVSMLLLVAGAALIVSTAMTAQMAFDSTAEVQAYYAAEAGLQDTLNIMRGNVLPSPTFATNPSGGYATLNKLSFLDAVTPSRANKSGETTWTSSLRLSRWLSYDSTYTDRVIVSPLSGASYAPLTGAAYSVVVSDPDDPSALKVNPSSASYDATYEPTRLLVRSTGYGPRGARKELRMIVGRSIWNIKPPAPIVIRGADDGASLTFDLGSSNSKDYTGVDNAGVETTKPSIAVSLSDWSETYTGLQKPSTVNDPEVSILDYFNNASQTLPDPLAWPSGANWRPYPGITTSPDGRVPAVTYPTLVETPDFLKTAAAARTFLYDSTTGAKEIAKQQNKYVTSYNGYVGSDTDADFLFVDGNCTLQGGSGLLIVTGNLYLDGNDDFYGMILVLGNGYVERSGTGNGKVLGAWMVARFNATSGDFLAPTYDVSGGGTGAFKFDSKARDLANKTGGRIVYSVYEN